MRWWAMTTIRNGTRPIEKIFFYPFQKFHNFSPVVPTGYALVAGRFGVPQPQQNSSIAKQPQFSHVKALSTAGVCWAAIKDCAFTKMQSGE
jgi:hypothetical protein